MEITFRAKTANELFTQIKEFVEYTDTYERIKDVPEQYEFPHCKQTGASGDEGRAPKEAENGVEARDGIEQTQDAVIAGVESKYSYHGYREDILKIGYISVPPEARSPVWFYKE